MKPSHATYILLALLVGCAPSEQDLTLFEDITADSGLAAYQGMTYGAAWGDFDGNGLPDLYVTNHLNEARLYRNLGNGRFEDVTLAHFQPADLLGDKHGAAWADYDNDGRPDLVQLTGAIKGMGEEPKRLFHNREGGFHNVAEIMGVANLEGRTRMPLWMDLDSDGRLDLFHGAEARLDDKTPPFTFVQQGGRFEQALEMLALAGRSVPFCIVTHLNQDGQTNLVCRVVGKDRTAQVFNTASVPARELDLLPVTAFEDIAAADFDNDGWMDLFMARKNAPGPVAFGQATEREIVADVEIRPDTVGQPMGFTFRAQGILKVQLKAANPGNALTPARIHLGQQGGNPAGLSFELDPAMPGIAGMAAHQPGKETAVYLGFTAPDQWEVRFTAAREALATGKPKAQQIQIRIDASAPIDILGAVGDTSTAEAAPARLFMNRKGALVEEGDQRGVNQRLVPGVNVVAGDFDNDMHVDLFVLASGDVGPQASLLLRNRGNGKFDVVRNAGGVGGCPNGVGDSVTTADIDGDGLLDLLLACGGSMGRSLGLPSDRGGYRLLRNVGNEHHWLMIDLEGSGSNRDGIGAIVRVSAGGITQTRVQDGGVHHRGQNHARLHFGLANNAKVDKITVRWPSGAVQQIEHAAANQVLKIKESRDLP